MRIANAGAIMREPATIYNGRLYRTTLDAHLLALDMKTGSSINAPAITYTYQGQQYVTIQSGLGGSVVKRFVGDRVPTGGAVWTFTLMPQ